jgi:hypothetical protein
VGWWSVSACALSPAVLVCLRVFHGFVVAGRLDTERRRSRGCSHRAHRPSRRSPRLPIDQGSWHPGCLGGVLTGTLIFKLASEACRRRQPRPEAWRLILLPTAPAAAQIDQLHAAIRAKSSLFSAAAVTRNLEIPFEQITRQSETDCGGRILQVNRKCLNNAIGMEYHEEIGCRFARRAPAWMPGAGTLPQPPAAVLVDLSR